MELQAVLARLVHDLRGPARQMGALMQMLSDGSKLSDDQKQLVDMLTTIAEKGATQIEGLSFFAQGIDVDDSSCELDFADVLNSVAKKYDSLTISGLETLHFKIDFNLQGLKTILAEIVSNAVKFSPADTDPVLNVSIDRQEGSNRSITFSSASIGAKFSEPEQVMKMLEAYSRDPRAADIEGFGMGLTIASYLVNQSGGSLVLTCDDDFVVYWHLAEQTQEVQEAA